MSRPTRRKIIASGLLAAAAGILGWPRRTRASEAAAPNMADDLALFASYAQRQEAVAGMHWAILQSGPDLAIGRVVASYVGRAWKQIPHLDRLYQGMQNAILSDGVGFEWRWRRGPEGIAYPAQFFPVHKSRLAVDSGEVVCVQPWLGNRGSALARPLSPEDVRSTFMYHRAGSHLREDVALINKTINKQIIPLIVWNRWPNMPARYMPTHRLIDRAG